MKVKRIVIAVIIISCLLVSLCSCTKANDRTCVVKVYDINGNLVKEYEGNFKVRTNHSNYVLWDDELGKRHTIYYTTFNVIVDEK